MMNPSTTNPTLLIAARMAAAGNYREANALLDTFTADESPVEVYLLRAKIFAQQSQFHDAIVQWQKALAKDPNNSEAQAGLKKTVRLNAGHLGKFALRANLFTIFGFAAIGIAGLIVWIVMRTKSPAEFTNVQPQADSAMVANPPNLTKQSDAFLDSLQAEIKNINGIGVEKEGDKLVIGFTDGLFASGSDQVSSRGDSLLFRLGRQLLPYDPQIAPIEITGYADTTRLRAGSRHSDNDALGLARATTVYEHLRKITGFPSLRLSVKSAGAADIPYFDDPSNNLARNRTVVIKITGASN